MMNLQDKVWYACYGSNILEERFLCYIQGGRPNGAVTIYDGCRDKTLPADNEDFYLCCELYFARRSRNWDNGGVAFVKTIFEPGVSTIGRIFLITKGQLIDIARQETKTETEIIVDFDRAIKDGNYIFKEPSWYGNLLYLGQQNGYPIFTLTNKESKQDFTRPSRNYIKTIYQGIKEAHNLDIKTIFEYLKTKKGIDGFYSDEELMNIIRE
jgi:hypothetical protein